MSCEPHVVLLTGAGGKLGAPFARYLKQRKYSLRALVRNASNLPAGFDAALEWNKVKTDPQSLQSLLEGVGSVVHFASSGSRDTAESIDAHVSMPQAILDHSVAAGVDRFIALSSIKAIAGEFHSLPLGLETQPSPDSDYGRFKLRGEQLVGEHPANADLATWILRLPMVYGAETAGGFHMLQKAAQKGWPIPVAAGNRRSFLYAENLFASIEQLLRTPRSTGTHLCHLADGDAISTKTLFQLIARAQGNSGRCVTLSDRWVAPLSGIPVIGPVCKRLLGSLEFDPASLLRLSGEPMPFSTEEAIAITAGDKSQSESFIGS